MSDKTNRTSAAAPTSLSAALAAGLTRPTAAKAPKEAKPTVFVNQGNIFALPDGRVVLELSPAVLDNTVGSPVYKRPSKDTPADRRREFTENGRKSVYEVDAAGNRILTGFTLGTIQARTPTDDGGQVFTQTTVTRHLPGRKG